MWFGSKELIGLYHFHDANFTWLTHTTNSWMPVNKDVLICDHFVVEMYRNMINGHENNILFMSISGAFVFA